jgi:hypothetical protein
VKRYESPMVRARAIVSDTAQATTKARRVAERMTRLPAMVIVDLELAEAPYHVFRWVACGANRTPQRRRADLVLHLRRSIERPLNGWLEERHLSAALRVLEEAANAVRRHGGYVVPGVQDIALDEYRAAIVGATKNKRASASESEHESDALPDVVTDEALELDAELGDSEQADDDNDAGDEGADKNGEEDTADEAPVSERIHTGRGRILRALADVVRVAIRSRDIEAAHALSDTLSLLCGERKAG